MKSRIPRGQLIAGGIGMLAVAAVQLASPWLFGLKVHFAGPGLDGALRAVFWFAIVGMGGGFAVYEVIKRAKARLGRPKNSN